MKRKHSRTVENPGLARGFHLLITENSEGKELTLLLPAARITSIKSLLYFYKSAFAYLEGSVRHLGVYIYYLLAAL